MRLTIKVIPRARQNKIVAENGDLKVFLHAPPVEGKANLALIELLAEHFKVKRSQIRVVSGLKSRRKIIEIN